MSDENPLENQLIKAGLWKRLVNYIVDYLVNVVIISFMFSYFESLGYPMLNNPASLRIRVVGVLLYALAYVAIEGGFQGKTLGKVFTRTRVVEYDGSIPNFETFIVRSFCRIIPFEPLSFLIGQGGWHDRFSKTIVIDETLSNRNNIGQT